MAKSLYIDGASFEEAVKRILKKVMAEKTDGDKKPDGDKDDEKDKPGYGEYKRGTGCYPKKYSKKDRRLGGHRDHGEGDHGKDANGKDVTTKDGHDDGWWTSIRVSFIVQILCLLAMICANILPHCMSSICDVVR